MVFSIRFDVARAHRLARANGWNYREWAKRAYVPERILERFLEEDQYLDLESIEDILGPLRLTAVELITTVTTDAGAVSFRRWRQVVSGDKAS
jgi:hypothetical protein